MRPIGIRLLYTTHLIVEGARSILLLVRDGLGLGLALRHLGHPLGFEEGFSFEVADLKFVLRLNKFIGMEDFE